MNIINVINYLNENQGAITAIATVAIAVLAGLTFWQNRTLIKENRILRKAGTEPKVVAYIKPNVSGNLDIDFILANIGQGPAFNVSFTFHFDEENFIEKKILFSNDPNRTAINVLPQDEQIKNYFGHGPSLISDPILKPFIVIVKYSNQVEEEFNEQFTLDINQYSGYNFSHSQKYKSTKTLKQIENTLEQILKSFTSLR